MVIAIMILAAFAGLGFLIGTFFGGRNPGSVAPPHGAGIWANIRHILDVFGDGIRDASTYALIILCIIVTGIEIHGLLGLPTHAVILVLGLLGLGVLVFTANANEEQKRKQGVKSGKAITKVGLIALVVLLLMLGFNGWVPQHVEAAVNVIAGDVPSASSEPWSTQTKAMLFGIGLILLAMLLHFVRPGKKETKHGGTP